MAGRNVCQAASIETPSHPHTPHTWTSAPSETATGVCRRESGRLRPRSLACSFPLGGRRATLHPGPHTPNWSGLESDWPWVRCRSLGHARGSSAEIAVGMNGIACQCLPQSGRLEDGTNKLVPGSWFLFSPNPWPARLHAPADRLLARCREVSGQCHPGLGACTQGRPAGHPGTVHVQPSAWRLHQHASLAPPPPQPYLYAPFPNPPSLSRYLRSTRPRHRRHQRCPLPPPSPRTTPPAVHMPGLAPRP